MITDPRVQIISIIIGSLTLSGFLEVLKFVYPDLKQLLVRKIEAKKSFNSSIDPLLKAAGELYGKMLSLAKEDFSTFNNPSHSIAIDTELNKKYVYYLFAQFWAQIENIRLQNQYIAFSSITNGSHLLKFIETVESRKYRILDRAIQRIIGESLLNKKDQKYNVMTLQEFIVQIETTSSELRRWILVLENKFSTQNIQQNRQQILRFGIIIAALLNHFDTSHKIVRERPIFTNKLSNKSKDTIKNNLLRYYLTFLKKKEQYYK